MPDGWSINDEAGLGSNWVPLDAPPIRPDRPALPAALAPSAPQYIQGSIPPSFQHDSHFVDTATTTPSAPKFSLMPLGIQASPVTNAAIQSTATKVVQANPTPISSIGLSIPNIFTPTTQTVNLPGPLSFSLAAEPIHTVLTGPIPGLSGLTAVFTNSYSVLSTPATSATITFNAPSAGWAFYMEGLGGNSNNTPSGWTTWGDGAAKTIPAGSTTATDNASTSLSWVNSVLTFTGAMPTFIGNHSALFSFPTTANGTASVTFSPTAGNYLIVSIYGSVAASAGNFVGGVNISDSAADTFNQLVSVSSGQTNFNGPTSLVVFIAPTVTGGSTTITATMSGKFTAGVSFTLSVNEVTPFPAGSGIPFFRLLSATDLPGIPTNKIVGAPLPLAFGGTGSDLHATGGLNKFVAQTTAGAGFTVVQPDFSNLAGAAAALATSYNGIPLVSNGLPSEIATVDLTNRSANIGATTLYAVPSTGQQMYRVSAYVVETTADAATSTLPNVQLVYTDFDSNVSVTLDVTPILAGAGMGQSAALTANTVGLVASGTLVINPKASTAVQYQTVNYASGTPAAMKYAIHLKLEAL